MTAIKRVVWKYALRPGAQTIEVPLGSKVVHVHEQDGQVCVWVERDLGEWADHNLSTLRLVVVATGEEFVGYEREPIGDWPNAGERQTYAIHRGTAHVSWTVWHVYELRNSPD